MTKPDPETAKRAIRRLHGEPVDDRRGNSTTTESGADTERVERLWRALEPPQTSAPPPDFATRTAERLRQRQATGSWSVAPAWARSTAGAALAAGLLLGVGVGRWQPSTPDRTTSELAVSQSEPADVWPTDSDGWNEDEWSEVWNLAYESSFGPASEIRAPGRGEGS
ncbi:MAG: hypothetical protein MPN21_04385 [Thermoanaerobaculia bacterium]|nr:hypothetical protein [Thermoanaerobaculia bacterium]